MRQPDEVAEQELVRDFQMLGDVLRSESDRQLREKSRHRQKCAMSQCKLKRNPETEQQTHPSRTLKEMKELLMTT